MQRLDESRSTSNNTASQRWSVTEEVTVAIRSLSRIRARVEQLSVDATREGCQVCWEHEAKTRFLWVENEVEREEPPESTACTACGRIYALSYVRVGWMH